MDSLIPSSWCSKTSSNVIKKKLNTNKEKRKQSKSKNSGNENNSDQAATTIEKPDIADTLLYDYILRAIIERKQISTYLSCSARSRGHGLFPCITPLQHRVFDVAFIYILFLLDACVSLLSCTGEYCVRPTAKLLFLPHSVAGDAHPSPILSLLFSSRPPPPPPAFSPLHTPPAPTLHLLPLRPAPLSPVPPSLPPSLVPQPLFNIKNIFPQHRNAQNNVELDCDTIPTCRMTCDGPNKELLLIITMHAGCMVEWLLHASWLKGVAMFTMFVFLNISRVVVVGGIVKLNWR